MTKRIFIVFFLLQIILIIGWYFLVYTAYDEELTHLNSEIENVSNKLSYAQEANFELEGINKLLKSKKEKYNNLKQSILTKNDISGLMSGIEKVAHKHNVRLTGFSPKINTLYSENDSLQIFPVEINLQVFGGYLNIGKFLENLDKSGAKITKQQILIEKMDGKSQLNASVTAFVYIRNNKAGV